MLNGYCKALIPKLFAQVLHLIRTLVLCEWQAWTTTCWVHRHWIEVVIGYVHSTWASVLFRSWTVHCCWLQLCAGCFKVLRGRKLNIICQRKPQRIALCTVPRIFNDRWTFTYVLHNYKNIIIYVGMYQQSDLQLSHYMIDNSIPIHMGVSLCISVALHDYA